MATTEEAQVLPDQAQEQANKVEQEAQIEDKTPLTFEDKVKTLAEKETAVKEAREAMVAYKVKLDEEMDKVLKELKFEEKIKEAADYFKEDQIKQMISYDPGTYPRECCKSMQIILNGEKKEFRWFKAKMMMEKEAEFIQRIKDFDVNSLEQWQIGDYLKQLGIEWYNYDRIKQYGKQWEMMFVWAYNVVAINIIKKMDPNALEFIRKIENCPLMDMFLEYNDLKFNKFYVAENDLLKHYLQMHKDHAEAVKDVKLQEDTIQNYGEHFESVEKFQKFLIQSLQNQKQLCEFRADQQTVFNDRQHIRLGQLRTQEQQTLPQQITNIERNIESNEKQIETLKEQNELVLCELPEKDEDFLEYDVKENEFFTYKWAPDGAEIAKDKREIVFDKNKKSNVIKINGKKPFLIGAFKLGLFKANHKPDKSDDAAYLQTKVFTNWNNNNGGLVTEVASLKTYDLSLGENEENAEFTRVKQNKTQVADCIYLQFEVKGNAGKKQFDKVEIKSMKFFY